MEELDFSNIDDSLSLSLFNDEESKEEKNEKTEENDDNHNTEVHQPVDPDTLFIDGDDEDDDDPESVGGKNIQGKQELQSQENEGTSSADFYSSIANVLKNDGVLEYLGDEDMSAITDADTFRTAIETEIKNRFDSKQQELLEAMGYGADVQQLYELQNMIAYLDEIDPERLKDDSDASATELRKQLIENHYRNLGLNDTQVAREVKKSFDAGTDIDDAQDALEAQKKLYRDVYQTKINSAKLEEEKRQAELQTRQQNLTNKIMDTEEPFEGIKIDKRVRARIVDNIYSPSVKGDDGHYYSKLQAYQNENPEDFLQKIGTIFTITDGFKNLDKLIGKAVNKEKNKNISDLENILKNQKNYGNSYRYVGNGRKEEQKPNSRYTLNI